MSEDKKLKTLNTIIEQVFFDKFETTYGYLKNNNQDSIMSLKENIAEEVTIPNFTEAVYEILNRIVNFDTNEIDLKRIFSDYSAYKRFRFKEYDYYLRINGFKLAITEIYFLNINKHHNLKPLHDNHIKLIFRKFTDNSTYMSLNNFLDAIKFINNLPGKTK